ncbi:MAG: 30S ribosomal protein S7 [Methanomassiliicoccales archaeon]
MEGNPEASMSSPLGPKQELLLFGKYGTKEVVVRDGGLAKYINLDPTLVPHTDGRHSGRWFGKARLNIVERLINNMMRTEVFTGKKMKAYRTVQKAFEVVEKKTSKNPIQVLVEALENAAPREEITRLQFGGISVPKAVDVAPSRRLDIALRNICKGAIQASFKNTKPIHECLADELILASKNDMNSFAVSKKEEVERVAASAR